VATELVSGAEIGRRLGVSREAVRQWALQESFPEPLGRVGRSVVWDWDRIQRWASRTKRPLKTHGSGKSAYRESDG
jgi:hypothetical protein